MCSKCSPTAQAPSSYLLLVLLVVAVATGPCAGNEQWHQEVAAETRVRHNHTANHCYHLPGRRTRTAITTLLPDGPLEGKSGVFQSTLHNLLSSTPADVVFFNPHGWPEERAQELRSSLGVPELQVLCIAQKDWAQQHRDRPWEFVLRQHNGPGYRSMCYWNSMRMMQVLFRMGFEWVIRIDTDSAFPQPVPYNLVAAMEERKAVYGFRALITEHSMFTRALPEAARFWLASENLQPTFIQNFCTPQSVEGLSGTGWNHSVIFNNFLVTKLSWWLQPHVHAWLTHLEQLRGSYKHRWGDAPVHTITLGMFLPPEQMLEFGFEYEHDVGSGLNTYRSGVFASSFPHYHPNSSSSSGSSSSIEQTGSTAPSQQPPTAPLQQVHGSSSLVRASRWRPPALKNERHRVVVKLRAPL